MKRFSGDFQLAFWASVPVMMGYGILGFAFGFLFVTQGYPWFVATLMSIFIYAGALQFVSLQFFQVKMGFFDMALTSLFVNIRQAFYGLSVLDKLPTKNWAKFYFIFGLTDETYGLLTSMDEGQVEDSGKYVLYLTGLNQFYWVFSTTVGALLGTHFQFNSAGLEFSLTALFVVLCIEQYKKLKTYGPFLIGAFSGLVAMASVPKNQMLIVAISIAVGLWFAGYLYAKRIRVNS